MLRGLTLDQSSSNTIHLSGTGHRLSWPVIASAKPRSPTESKSGAGFQARNADILVGASGRAPPLRITPLQILRSARRFCRNPSPGGASDTSPVREHWERRERQATPGTGRKNWSRVLLSPRAGAGKFAIRTQGSRPGLFSCALRASGTFFGLRLCRFAGQAILPAAAFQAAFSGPASVFDHRRAPAESRRQPGLAAPQSHAYREAGKRSLTVAAPIASGFMTFSAFQ